MPPSRPHGSNKGCVTPPTPGAAGSRAASPAPAAWGATRPTAGSCATWPTWPSSKWSTNDFFVISPAKLPKRATRTSFTPNCRKMLCTCASGVSGTILTTVSSTNLDKSIAPDALTRVYRLKATRTSSATNVDNEASRCFRSGMACTYPSKVWSSCEATSGNPPWVDSLRVFNNSPTVVGSATKHSNWSSMMSQARALKDTSCGSCK
mmetsp:Transcript_40395/g.80300  ORF Transcript_40395/g.80300 Transcript_40395/m.80300 type:complete len:207 (+) Transcript_40395:45-665(+)